MVMKYFNSTKGFNHVILMCVWHGTYCIPLTSQPKGLANTHANQSLLPGRLVFIFGFVKPFIDIN